MGELTDLKDKILSCTNCSLQKGCKSPVPFRGGRSQIMVIGEAPGDREDLRNRPFVGPAGRWLRQALAEAGIEWSSVTSANAVSCYPHRKPTREEVYRCRAHLWRQIRYTQPSWILALGETANFSLGKQDQKISELRNVVYRSAVSRVQYGRDTCVPNPSSNCCSP